MTPNLYLFVRKTAPWNWIPHKDRDSYRLHYQSEPVPGIYLVNPTGRYLVAMKPYGTSRDAKFFKSENGYTKHEITLYGEDTPAHYMSPIDYSWSPNRDNTSLVATSTCTAHNIQSGANSPTGQSTRIADHTRRTVKIVLPTPEAKSNPYHPPNKTYRKSPLSQSHNATDMHEDSIPENPIPRKPHPKSTKKISQNKGQLRSIDIVGFRPIARPLLVQYSTLLHRWMFAKEIEQRKMVAETCASTTCTHGKDIFCKQPKVLKQFTVLDDRITFLLTGDVGKEGKVKERRNVDRDSSPLYTLTTKGSLRRLNEKEMDIRRAQLEVEEGTFIARNRDHKDYIAAKEYVRRRGWPLLGRVEN